MNNFQTPPPFVRCNCTYGRYSQFVKSAPGSALDGAEYEITKPCGVCAHSPLPGWIPIYYTPEQYRDWIRRENNIPDYELPDDIPCWQIIRQGSDLLFFMEPYGNLKSLLEGKIIIATDAGRPLGDWSKE